MDAVAAKGPRDIPRPGQCVVGFHDAAVVWTFGSPVVPRRICAVHIARAISTSWRIVTDARFRGLTEP